MGDPIVLEGLTKAYGDFIAVDSVDMKVKKNSFTASSDRTVPVRAPP